MVDSLCFNYCLCLGCMPDNHRHDRKYVQGSGYTRSPDKCAVNGNKGQYRQERIRGLMTILAERPICTRQRRYTGRSATGEGVDKGEGFMWEKVVLLFLITILIHGSAIVLVVIFRNWLRKSRGIPKEYIDEIESGNPIDDRLNLTVGILERIFFTIAVVISIQSSVIAMIGWETLKMLTGWNKAFAKEDKDTWPIEARTKMAFCSLYAGMFSLLFALFSGLVIKWFIEWIK
jgi:hypothetical protein